MIKNIVIAGLILCSHLNAQSLFFSDWTKAGVKVNKSHQDTIINVLDFGADSSGFTSCSKAINAALNIYSNKTLTIYFPEGRYFFDKPIIIKKSNIILKGNGSHNTKFIFDLNHKEQDCISFLGQIISDSSSISSNLSRGLNRITVLNGNYFHIGNWLKLTCNDSSYMFSNWAYKSLGQVFQIKDIQGNEIELNSQLRFNYLSVTHPYIEKIQAIEGLGLECFSLFRLDSTVNQTSNINFEYVVNSWIKGIESANCNFAHVSISRCANLEIVNSYFHHAFAYGGNGQGYGISIQYSSSECKVENNIFLHLRHSILFQAGANGNVIAYNYFVDPFWKENLTPTNSSGDIVMHGNFPFANLIESNINQNMLIDNSHGKNGPFNTWYRNRSELYGMIVSTNTCSDSMQIIENEITNPNLGFYIIQGIGNLQLSNKVKSIVNPIGSVGIHKTSLHLSDQDRPYCYPSTFNWPYIAGDVLYNTGSIPAKERFDKNLFTLCDCDIINHTTPNNLSENLKLDLFPNPGDEKINIYCNYDIDQLEIYHLYGEKVYNFRGPNLRTINLSNLENGIYLIKIKIGTQYLIKKWTKV